MYIVDLIAHAECQWAEYANNTPVPLFGGRMNDADLTAWGREQARRLGQHAIENGIRPTGFFSSPAVAARRTHEISATVMGLDAEPVIDDLLQERNWGDWTGQPRDVRFDPSYWEQSQALGHDFAPPRGESVNQAGDRFLQSLYGLTTKYEPGYYWFHTHSHLITAVAGAYLNWSPEDINESAPAACSQTRLLIIDGESYLEFYNRETI